MELLLPQIMKAVGGAGFEGEYQGFILDIYVQEVNWTSKWKFQVGSWIYKSIDE